MAKISILRGRASDRGGRVKTSSKKQVLKSASDRDMKKREREDRGDKRRKDNCNKGMEQKKTWELGTEDQKLLISVI